MARMSRFRLGGAWVHVHAKVAGYGGEYVLSEKACQRKMISILEHYAGIYYCEVAAFSIMGNHWHGIIRFELPRKMSDDELFLKAKKLYPNSLKMLDAWTKSKWERLTVRLFDLSELMRNVQAAFARWYNKRNDRQGRFWADRFKSTVLGSEHALLGCMLYVDLNAVRAGIVKRPEDYEGSSACVRELSSNHTGWLNPLRDILGINNSKKAWIDYRARLYYRGSVPTKEQQAVIAESIIEAERESGFISSGAYRKRIRYFTDGILLGGEELIREQLTKLRNTGHYLRRIHPIPQPDTSQMTLREQRSHAVHLS